MGGSRNIICSRQVLTYVIVIVSQLFNVTQTQANDNDRIRHRTIAHTPLIGHVNQLASCKVAALNDPAPLYDLFPYGQYSIKAPTQNDLQYAVHNLVSFFVFFFCISCCSCSGYPILIISQEFTLLCSFGHQPRLNYLTKLQVKCFNALSSYFTFSLFP